MARISLDIIANISGAVKNIDSFTQRTTDSMSRIQKSVQANTVFQALELGLNVASKAAQAFGSVVNTVEGVLKSATSAAIESDDSIQKLNVALKLSGDFSQKASQDFQNFASSLQKTTGVSDDAVLRQTAYAKSLGLSNDQTKQLITTAVNLSAVTGDDLNVSVDNLAKTYNGVSGALGKTFVEVKRLTVEQLANGDAVRFLGDRYKDAAAQMTNTFGGAVRLAGSSFGELQETFGKLITQNPLIIAAVKQVGVLFENIQTIIEENKVVITELVNEGFLGLVKAIPLIIKGFGLLDESLTSVANGYRKLRTFTDKFIQGALGASDSELQKIEGDFAVDISNSNKSLEQRQKVLDQITASTDNWVGKLQESAKVQNQSSSAGVKLHNAEIKATEERIKATKELVQVERDRINAFKRGQIEKAGKNFFEAFQPSEIPAQSNIHLSKEEKDKLETQKQVAGLASGLNTALKGASGAATLVSNIVGKVADSILPGIGGLVGEIVGQLAQGPEKVKEFITSFTEAIPAIVENILLSIPVLVEELVKGLSEAVVVLIERLPEIFQELIDKLLALFEDPAFTQALVNAAVRFGLAMQTQAPQIIQAFSIALIKESPRIMAAMAQGAFQGFKEAFSAFLPGGGGLGALGSVGGGLGGLVGGAAKGIGSIFGFAEGGIVPGGAPFIDRVPAFLTPGERVLNRDEARNYNGGGSGMSQELIKEVRALRDSLGASQNLSVGLNISERDFAKVQLDMKRSGFRVA